MVTIGVDAHKQVDVAVAVDEVGRPLGEWNGADAPEAWQALLDWASQWGERRWGIEGTGNYGKGLAQHLVADGERVFEVNPRLTAEVRRRARRQDKNDRLDAQAVAVAVVRHGDELPVVLIEDDGAAVLKELCRQREQVKSQVARMRNQLHQQLFLLDPAYKRTVHRLSTPKDVMRLEGYAAGPSPLQRVQAEGVQHLALALRLEMEREKVLKKQIETLANERYAALASLEGAGALTAGEFAAVLGTHSFTSDAPFAAYCAGSPLETSSAGRVRHRLNRGGSRRMNCALHRVALTQWKLGGEGHAYIESRMGRGKSWLEAVRALKRFIARRVWHLWNTHYGPLSGNVSLVATS